MKLTTVLFTTIDNVVVTNTTFIVKFVGNLCIYLCHIAPASPPAPPGSTSPPPATPPRATPHVAGMASPRSRWTVTSQVVHRSGSRNGKQTTRLGEYVDDFQEKGIDQAYKNVYLIR